MSHELTASINRLIEIVNESYSPEGIINNICKELAEALSSKVFVTDRYNNILVSEGLSGSKPPKPSAGETASAVIPLLHGQQLIGYLSIYGKMPLSADGELMAKASCPAINLALRYALKSAEDSKTRSLDSVKSALDNLSYSELTAVVHMLSEIQNKDGVVVASQISKNTGVTRSIIVSALKKLAGAGLIETRSMGMKGTYIKIINSCLKAEVNKLKP